MTSGHIPSPDELPGLDDDEAAQADDDVDDDPPECPPTPEESDLAADRYERQLDLQAGLRELSSRWWEAP